MLQLDQEQCHWHRHLPMLTSADLLCILCHQSLSRVPSPNSNRQSLGRSGENGIELQAADVMSLRCLEVKVVL